MGIAEGTPQEQGFLTSVGWGLDQSAVAAAIDARRGIRRNLSPLMVILGIGAKVEAAVITMTLGIEVYFGVQISLPDWTEVAVEPTLAAGYFSSPRSGLSIIWPASRPPKTD